MTVEQWIKSEPEVASEVLDGTEAKKEADQILYDTDKRNDEVRDDAIDKEAIGKYLDYQIGLLHPKGPDTRLTEYDLNPSMQEAAQAAAEGFDGNFNEDIPYEDAATEAVRNFKDAEKQYNEDAKDEANAEAKDEAKDEAAEATSVTETEEEHKHSLNFNPVETYSGGASETAPSIDTIEEDKDIINDVQRQMAGKSFMPMASSSISASYNGSSDNVNGNVNGNSGNVSKGAHSNVSDSDRSPSKGVSSSSNVASNATEKSGTLKYTPPGNLKVESSGAIVDDTIEHTMTYSSPSPSLNNIIERIMKISDEWPERNSIKDSGDKYSQYRMIRKGNEIWAIIDDKPVPLEKALKDEDFHSFAEKV